MSHLYPLAPNGLTALAETDLLARSKADAVRLCPFEDHHIKALETEWLTLSPDEHNRLQAQADAGVGAGFVQRYENEQGASVLAVTYWKIVPNEAAMLEPDTPSAPDLTAARELDHTDDLYFRVGRTKTKRRPKKPDPNQLDLFGKIPE